MLFAVREAVQQSLGFSPMSLVFNHTPRCCLSLCKRNVCHLSLDLSPEKNVLDYVSQFHEHLCQANTLTKQPLSLSQLSVKRRYERSSVFHHFQVEDKVLALLPILGSAL